MLVVQDPIISAGPVMRVLSDRLLRSIKPRLKAGGPKVWPLTVLTADALDRLSAVIQITGERLDSILKSCRTKDVVGRTRHPRQSLWWRVAIWPARGSSTV